MAAARLIHALDDMFATQGGPAVTGTAEPPRLDGAQRAAVRACLDDAKAIVAENGVCRAALDRVKARLLRLAERRDLFHFARFPVLGDGRKNRSSIYLLDEDDDHSFALFAVSELEGNMSPPHDHTTWAVLAGIEGEELNRFYERIDDGSVEGRAAIRETGEDTVKAGTGVALMPDDIHSIHCVTAAPTLDFHLYGRSIAHLPERKMFNMRDGTYRVFPAQSSIVRL